jgi:hypothetical protein
MPLSDIRVAALTGKQLRPYLHSMAKLRVEIFREFPYFKEGSVEEELNYLKTYHTSQEAIGVLVFDNTTLVGVSAGLPLLLENEEIKKPFLEKGIDLSSCYFFSESTLLKKYRGRGIGHHFFDLREMHVHHLKTFKRICFCIPEQIDDHPLKPHDYMSLKDFWRKRGYVHIPDMHCTLSWQDLIEKNRNVKKMTVWVKELSPL